VHLGVDLGTSAVKALLADAAGDIFAAATAPLTAARPHPGWSEQDPRDWEAAAIAAIDAIAAQAPRALAACAAIGLAGQMHGAVFVDAAGTPLRPCILWNDGRAAAECAALEAAFPALRQVTGNRAMAGFTAPKALWLRRHEPEAFAALRMVMLPKAWLRRRLTGDSAEEMSDASGTLWLDVGAREWSDAALAACGLDRTAMPRLVEGNAQAGTLLPALAARWNMARPPIFAGGAGDNAAAAIGLGAVRPGDAFLSLGTSGVLFAVTARFAPNPGGGVHTFCHALPGLWHQMGVTLSAAAALAWWAGIAGRAEAELLAELAAAAASPGTVLFLPHLAGERTPHADTTLRAAFAGIDHATTRADLTRAVLEGVAFAFADSRDALGAAGTDIGTADLVGGGARSAEWAAILASVTGITLRRVAASEHAGALGAARLARMAATGEAAETACPRPAAIATVAPDRALAAAYAARLAQWRALTPAVKGALQ